MEPRGTSNRTEPPAPVEAPPEWKPTILTRTSLAAVKRKREQEGHLFPLEVTGGYARVRLPSLLDRAILDQLPRHIQGVLAEQLESDTPSGRKRQEELVAAMSEEERRAHFMRLVVAQDELAQRMMVLGWIEPRVVLTEAELPEGDDGVILASDVHAEDRLRYANLLSLSEKEGAKEIERFRREQMESVSAQPALQAAPASERDPESAGAVVS